MRTMKTTIALSAALLSVSTLWASSTLAQSGAAEAGEDKRPRIRLAEETAKPSTEAPSEAATAPQGSSPPEAAATAAPQPASETAVPGTPESEVGTEPSTGLGPAGGTAEVEATGAPDAEGESEAAEDKSQPRVIDISKREIAEEDLPPPAEPKIRGSQLPFTYHLNHVDVSGGFRVVGTPSAGLEPFLVDPVLVDGYVRGGMAFAVTDRIAVAPHLELGGASTSATVRGMSSQLDKTHLSLGLEGRYHFIHRMFGYVRVAPGLEFVSASIGDDGDSGELVNDNKRPGSVAFGLDAALGASLRLFGSDDGRKRKPRLWVFAEGGYRVSGDHTLSMVVDGGGPRRAVPIELAPLDFSGGFFSTGLMASF